MAESDRAQSPRRTTPIAIVGLACRLPQAPTPAAFWRLLCEAESAITPLPADRWPTGPESAPSFAGLLDRVDTFDAGFFGVPPREAVAMDPQQRLMLELVWEALEDAGIRPETLAGSRTGVFASAIWDDYAALAHRRGPDAVTPYTMTGLHRGIIANRVSHRLGLRGPSLTVDAAQSSGLVAVHLACESLRQGEADLALVGGVNLILAEDSMRAADARFSGLSPDGRCYTFDARANGFVRGEGGGVVLLKPLDAAVADGDPVYCVIRGSAVNNDGDTDGLTRPSALAQEDVLRQAYARAGVAPAGVQYVELHGTGTPVGDPVEAAALGAALGRERPGSSPLRVGSAKTNVGHLEAAAGIVGLLKAALSIRHRRIPPSLNFATASPRIPLAELGLRVQTELSGWPHPESELTAGVSSFGMGGTNCHVVLTEPPVPHPTADSPRADEPRADESQSTRSLADEPQDTPSPPVIPWLVSAASPAALAAQADALRERLAGEPGLDPVDVGHSLATTRTSFTHRAVVLGADGGALRERLDALAEGRDAAGLIRGHVTGGGVAVLFSGQGSQRLGMGRELYAAWPVFAAALREVCAELDPHLDTPLLDVVFAVREPGVSPLLDRTSYTQPALFAIEVALYRLVESWGLKADHLIGHSVGEIAAAHVAGVLSLGDACTLVAARGRLMQSVAAPGAMAAWQATSDEAGEALRGREGQLGIAAVNGPASVVVSGDRDAVLEATAVWQARGRKASVLRVSHAFHSPHMDGILAELRAVAAGLTFAAPAIPIVSDVTGLPATEEQLRSPDYWADHARLPVLFTAGVRQLCAAGVTTFVELGPDAALAGMARECFAALPDGEPRPAALAVMRRDRPEVDTFVAALAEAHVRGVALDWDRAFDGRRPRRVSLPTYAFQRERYWHDDAPAPQPAVAGASAAHPAGQPAEPRPAESRPVAVTADRAELLALVRNSAAVVLGHGTPDRIDPALTFKQLGFDSLAATELADRLGAATGLRLPATLTFDHPTPAAVVAHLRAERDRDLGGPADEPVAAAGGRTAVDEPVAVVAISCRYPGGADSSDALWRLVDEGVDAVGGFPRDRGWDLAELLGQDPRGAGASSTGEGGFLYDAGEFDAEFFGISPREALATDPQQRLVLELSWELLERAGIDPTTLKGSPTGVFVGATSMDYGPRLHEATAELEGHLLTGGTSSVASGRVSYTLGLQGPALTVDTACSSSLVAMHLAARSLRDGECDLALAGGVTVMATPGMFTGFSRQRGLAPDGRCKPFAAAADGTGWGEGAGMVLLERLSDARRNGHQVLAVIRGSAVNQDGASNGLTAPNGPSQQRVIRQALANARLGTADVDAVEAHGTGTTLGDPIEAQALLATYGKERPEDRPLWLGSVKSNIGHTQAAAGIAGVIKMIMAMRHGHLPASLHIDEPTPHVDWTDGTVRLLTESTPWPDTDRPRRAAVSSFGISGTNAHVILEQAPQPATAEPTPDHGAVVPWALSARTPEALRAQAANLAELLTAGTGSALADTGWSLATTRSVFEHRAVVAGADRDELLAGLKAVAAGESAPEAAGDVSVGPVLVFPGQGSQWLGMGVELLDASPVFAARIAECEQALAEFTDWSLTEVLRGAEGCADIGRVDVVQPVLWAVMVSLAAVWESFGVVPAAVIGHSQGEIAAACVSGALSLRDAAKVVALRSRALRALAGHGGMASLGLSGDEATKFLTGLGEEAGQVAVAALNGPFSTVVSGPPEQVAAAVAACEAAGHRGRLIDVDYASHGPQVDRLADVIAEELAGIAPRSTEVAYYSGVTGGAHDPEGLDAGYWFTSLRQQVRFAPAIAALLADGYRVFVEASPHPVLTLAMRECFEEAGVRGVTVPTLRRDDGGPARLADSLGGAFAAGLAIDWTRWFTGDRRPREVALPTYPFQRRRYWLPAGDGRRDRATPGTRSVGHPLLSSAVALADGGLVLNGRVPDGDEAGWLGGHTVGGVRLVPGAALVEWALRAADEAGAGSVEELVLRAPLALPGPQGAEAQVVVAAADEDGRRELRIFSRPADAAQEWTCHAVGVLAPEGAGAADAGRSGSWPPPGARAVELAGIHDGAEARGYGYGPQFQGVRALWRDGLDLVAEIALPAETGADDGFGIHPVLLDAALQPALLTDDADTEQDADRVWLPFTWSGVTLFAGGADHVRVRLSPQAGGAEDERALRITMADATGAPVLVAESVVLRPRSVRQLRAAGGPGTAGLFTTGWTSLTAERCEAMEFPTAGDGGWAALGGAPATADTARHADLAALLAALDAGAPVPAVVLCAAPDSAPGAEDPAAVDAVSTLLDEWADDSRLAGTHLVLLTRGAVALDEAGDGPPDPGAAAARGFADGARSWLPGRVVLLDTDHDGGHDAADHGDEVAAAVRLAIALDEPRVALRAGMVLAPRLARVAPTAAVDDGTSAGSVAHLDPNGTVLVAGGGPLARAVASHLAAPGRAGRVLLAHPDPSDEMAAWAADLAESGARVDLATVDATDPTTLSRVVDHIDPAHPLTGVVHVAEASGHEWARVRQVTGAAMALHAATAGLPLAFFTLLSDATAHWDGVTTAESTAADAFCDALVAARRRAGLVGRSVAVGPWAARAASADDAPAGTDVPGVGVLGVEPGLALLDAAEGTVHARLVAVDLDTRALAGRPAQDLPAPLRALAVTAGGRGAVRATAASAVPVVDWAGRLAGLSSAEQRRVVLDLVRGHAATVLGLDDAEALRVHVPFKDLGFDSLTAVELRDRLVAATGLRLPAAVVFRHPTLEALARRIGEELTPEVAAVEEEADDPLLADLARLESALEGDAGPDAGIEAVAARLESALAKWKAAAAAPAPGSSDKLRSATADELLAFIDNELGVPSDGRHDHHDEGR